MRIKFLKSMLNEKCGLGGNRISRNGKVYQKKLGWKQGLVKGAELCLNPYFFGWLEK